VTLQNAVAYDDSNAVYIAGQTQSLKLPIQNATQSALAGAQNAFLAVLLCRRSMQAPRRSGLHQLGGWAWTRTIRNKTVQRGHPGRRHTDRDCACQFIRSHSRSAGIGNGYHAFNYTTPNSLKDGAAQSISLRISQTSTSIGAPQSLTCAAINYRRCSIDMPASGVTVSGTVTVAGWAIEKRLDGRSRDRTRASAGGRNGGGHGDLRSQQADVCAAYPGRPVAPT